MMNRNLMDRLRGHDRGQRPIQYARIEAQSAAPAVVKVARRHKLDEELPSQRLAEYLRIDRGRSA